ncbi:uncharacterized protein LOC115452713 [Manduca sexta]|uniref:Reverse transcriptase domain-containing protein n=1 Tax=Manduca sexta TaxID=7130 RepID=A0A922CZA0_MANSE|nr:uncharacterized protein LOC115452713 [Manduca sexta]KAG6463957.1 hypothetical protein O3G_MSEX014183 [Manduca sexta]
MEDVFKTLDWTARGVNVNGERISHLRFADDIVIFAETLEELSGMLNDLGGSSRRVGLGMNLDKTKVMFNKHVVPGPISVDGIPLEVVQDYVYLGQTIQLGRHNFEREADRRIRLGWAAFGRFRRLYVDDSTMLEDENLRALRPTGDDVWCRDVDTDGKASP